MDYMLRSLVVGIDEYADIRYRDTARLRYARSDALSIAETLRTSTAFRLEADNPYLLTNQKASADEVRRVMDGLFSPERLNRKTIALFYFAGHGVLKDGRVFLCYHDVDFAHPEQKGIDLQQVYHWLTTSGAACTIAILDTCFSGGFTNNAQKSTSIAEQARRAIVDPHAPDGKTMAIFAACQSDQQAREDPQLGHGLFTYHILRGWQAGEAHDPDGMVTLSGLKNYLLYQFEHELQKPKLSLVSASRIPLWRWAPPVLEPPASPETPRVVPRPDNTRPLSEIPSYPDYRGHQIEEVFRLPGPQNKELGKDSSLPEFNLGGRVPCKPQPLRRKVLISLAILLIIILFITVMKLHG